MDNKKNVVSNSEGLNLDHDPIEQPKGTYRFALNTVNETDLGDFTKLSNELANESCVQLPADYIPLGEVYLNDGNTAIFSVKEDNSLSEIGIVDSHCNYTTIVNHDLGFKLTHQIDVTFRLRKGCERVLYWVDGNNNVPMNFNLDKVDEFKKNGQFVKSRFYLIQSYDKHPIIDKVEVVEGQGQLPPGSINIAIQYVNANFVETQWINISETINIYTDPTNKPYEKIKGSINLEEDIFNHGKTNKSLKVSYTNLDDNFPFYRLAFIEASNSSGLVSKVYKTNKIPITNNIFTFNGVNFEELGTEAEINFFTEFITSAEHIEQVENRLILANTTGIQEDLCELQQIASLVKVDCITKQIDVGTMNNDSPKNPTINFYGHGFMPGEIYSLGLSFVLTNNFETPVYHIPGKNVSTAGLKFTNLPNSFPMSVNNTSNSNSYSDNSTCSGLDYWGVDSEGTFLKDTNVRHHRFPSRKELELPLIEDSVRNNTVVHSKIVVIKARGTGDNNNVKILGCSDDEINDLDCAVCRPWSVVGYYTVNGEERSVKLFIDPYNLGIDLRGLRETYPLNEIAESELINTADSPTIQLDRIEYERVDEENDPGYEVINGTYGEDDERGSANFDIEYFLEVKDDYRIVKEKDYYANILGIHLSGIEIPLKYKDKIVGYNVYYQKRTEEEKTILDSGIIMPVVKRNNYKSQGLINPEVVESIIDKKSFNLLYPEHRFRGKEYSTFSSLEQQGMYQTINYYKGYNRHLDVLGGSSIDDKNLSLDIDGFSLKMITRDSELSYKTTTYDDIQKADVEESIHLNSLENYKTYYNISADNKSNLIITNRDINYQQRNRFPYVYIKRDLDNNYSNFRTDQYLKINDNLIEPTEDSYTTYRGDIYVSSLKYFNSTFYDNRIAERGVKRGILPIIGGFLLVAVGIILIPFTGGTSTLLLGAGLTVLGGGLMLAAAGFKRELWNKTYGEEYKKGLRDTLVDDWVTNEYKYAKYPKATTPQDDEIQWIGECFSGLFFESQINMSLRYGLNNGFQTVLDSPSIIESGRTELEHTGDLNVALSKDLDIIYVKDTHLPPVRQIENYFLDKLTVFNVNKEHNREYLGHVLGELYNINEDYQRLKIQKTNFHLPIEYDCCSDCREEFPHRVHYSEQSFQEELSDNYKVFLSNNYRDIEGETGVITNLFRIKANLYIHTQEALWHLPQSFQERITNDIISFIGTGEYFSIPPTKILDGDKNSGGNEHKWAVLEVPYGVFFISERERKVYQFNGNELKNITLTGLSTWFKKYGGIQLLSDYYASSGNVYPYDNNPSNRFGVGYISTYDTKFERIIFTKKDFIPSDELVSGSNFRICAETGQMIKFPDFNQTIEDCETDGYKYLGIENCKMKFERTVYEDTIVKRYQKVTISEDTIVVPFFDSTSIAPEYINNLSDTLNLWFPQFKQSVNNGDNNITFLNPQSWNIIDEDWLEEPMVNFLSNVGINKSVLFLVFVDETNTNYHGGEATDPMHAPRSGYLTDMNNFITTLHPQFENFVAINYPLYREETNPANYPNNDGALARAYLQHTIGAIEGRLMNQAEVDALNKNSIISQGRWDTIKNSLKTNPYVGLPAMKDYGWLYKEDRCGIPNSNSSVDCPDEPNYIITPCQFTKDVEDLLSVSTEVVETEVTVKKPVIEYKFVEGVVVENPIKANNSWTMSYSLKKNHWVSWHSYLPNFYFYIAEKFYSWIYGKRDLWKHNKMYKYQTYYEEYYPHIVEYVSLSHPLQTRIWEDISLHTEARKHDANLNSYVDKRFITYNKGIMYNTRQCTGELEFKVKDESVNYLINQIINSKNGSILIDRNERDWSLNDIKDMRVDYDVPIFNENILALQNDYYIDKVLNNSSIDQNKPWNKVSVMRDKYLVIRLIFDKFDDVKLIMNYSVENEKPSLR